MTMRLDRTLSVMPGSSFVKLAGEAAFPFLGNVHNILSMEKKIDIECADVIDFPCDVLILKYAQAHYGADGDVAYRLTSDEETASKITPLPDEYVFLPSEGKIAAKQVLFVGVNSLGRFGYGQIRSFANYSMEIVASHMPEVKHVAMTMHGVGYGLDEREAFLAQMAGLLDAFREYLVPNSLECITIVERNRGRATRIKNIFDEYIVSKSQLNNERSFAKTFARSEIDAGSQSNKKPHIFVAMPFTEDMEDVYGFGIQGPINAAGYLCERVDMTTFTGDILGQIKVRIETASLVIADLTGANPNVYLEVGYAWGRKKPTLLIAKKHEELKFDVRGHRCLIYKNISDLANKLKKDLVELLS